MPVIVGRGDQLVLRNGSPAGLSKPSVPIGMFAGGGSISLSGSRAASYQTLYETQPWVRIAVAKLNMQIARLPLKTYRMIDGSKGEGERERVRDHPLANLLARSWRRSSPATFKQKTAFPMLLHGNSLFAKGVDSAGAAPSALIPLDWRFVTPHCDDAGEVLFWETSQSGRPERLAPDSVVHFRWESGSGDLGVSPLKSLGVTLRTEDSAQRHQAASFDNGVRPSTVYILPPDVDLDEEDKEELRKMVQAQQGGVDRAFQMALVSGGGSIEALQHTAVEAELIDQRKLNREEVAAVYDIPPPLIGILDHATYSNVAEMHRMLYGMVLGPWLTLIEETIQAQLIDSYVPWAEQGLFVEFDLAEVLKGDTLAEVNAIRSAIATGIMTPNEGRSIRNLAPSTQDGMDKFYLPTNNMNAVGSVSEPKPAAQLTDTGLASLISGHLERAASRVARKGVGSLDPERVQRELAADLDDQEVAAQWAAKVAQAETPDAIRALVE